MQRLQDRVVVVTGAGSGLGLASARRMAAEGARIVAVDIDEAAAAAAAKETGGEFVAADVASEDQVRDLFDGVAERPGRLAPCAGGEPHLRVPVLQVRAAAHA